MKSKAPLLLMELMVMLLVFALASALCLQAFVQSDALSAQSEARDRAVTLCQSAAEVLRGNGSDFNATAEQLGLELGEGSTMYCYYDENWAPSQNGEGSYRLSIHRVSGTPNGLGAASISVDKTAGEQDTLFALEVAWQEEVSAGG